MSKQYSAVSRTHKTVQVVFTLWQLEVIRIALVNLNAAKASRLPGTFNEKNAADAKEERDHLISMIRKIIQDN